MPAKQGSFPESHREPLRPTTTTNINCPRLGKDIRKVPYVGVVLDLMKVQKQQLKSNRPIQRTFGDRRVYDVRQEWAQNNRVGHAEGSAKKYKIVKQ